MKIGIVAVLVLAMVVCVGAASADHPETEHGDWKSVGSDEAVYKILPTQEGNYNIYLIADIALTETWTVPAGTTNLCLNGHVINANGGNFSVITVGNGATLNLYDCGTTEHKFTVASTGLWTLDKTNGSEKVIGGVITGGNRTDGYGGGVTVNGGTFTMDGGNVIGNTVTGGVEVSEHKGGSGGVYITNSGRFTMNDGSITGNVRGDNNGGGGGVMIQNSGEFTMNDGSIVGNTAKGRGGGGVDAWSGEFNMTGGTIAGNNATENGGGVYVNADACTCNVSGNAIIKGNKATQDGGGVYVGMGNGPFKVSGSPVIKENKKINGTTETNNVWLASELVLQLAGKFTGDIRITGVRNTRIEDGVDYFGTVKDDVISVVKDTDDAAHFRSDNGEYCGIVASGNLLVWSHKTVYIITYRDKGDVAFSGTHESDYPTIHKSGTPTTLKSATKTGYTFDGWFKDVDCTGNVITTLGADVYNADITLYAKWTAIPPQSSSGSSVTVFRGSSTAAFDGTIAFDRSTVVTKVIVTGASGAKVTPNSNKGENGWYGFDLTVTDAPNGGEIYYQVPLDVIAIKGYTEHDVCLYHKENGAWTALPTYLVTKDARYAYYKSVTESFSPFYIGFETGAARTENEEPIPVEPVVEPVEPIAPITPQPAATPFPVLGLVAALGAAAVFLKRRQ